jgi:hypothetical protein
MNADKAPLETATAPTKKPIEYKRRDDLLELYANNAQFLSSAWDLKIVFGELDQSLGSNVVVQHSAITMPWSHAKVMALFLLIHVTGHESQMGRIPVPHGIIPEPPKEAPLGTSEKTLKAFKKLYDDFIAANPEAAPESAKK